MDQDDGQKLARVSTSANGNLGHAKPRSIRIMHSDGSLSAHKVCINCSEDIVSVLRPANIGDIVPHPGTILIGKFA
jgi:hypothetical protein